MKANKFYHPMLYVGGFLAVTIGFSVIVMLLWNWLIPMIFGLSSINFLQALGLLILTRILFGSFPRHFKHHPHQHYNPMFDKWTKMSAEERAEFVKKRKERWAKMNDEEKEAFLQRRRHPFEHPFDVTENSEK